MDYAALLSAVLRTGMADLIDMELAMAARCPADLSGLVMEMRALAYECGVPVIYSTTILRRRRLRTNWWKK